MLKLFWRNQDEAIVKEIIDQDPNKVVAVAYVAGWDADVFVVSDSEDEYQSWMSETITSPYAGWATKDVSGLLK
jgi:hypothetical protein